MSIPRGTIFCTWSSANFHFWNSRCIVLQKCFENIHACSFFHNRMYLMHTKTDSDPWVEFWLLTPKSPDLLKSAEGLWHWAPNGRTRLWFLSNVLAQAKKSFLRQKDSKSQHIVFMGAEYKTSKQVHGLVNCSHVLKQGLVLSKDLPSAEQIWLRICLVL